MKYVLIVIMLLPSFVLCNEVYNIKDSKGNTVLYIEDAYIKDVKGYKKAEIKKDGYIVDRKGYRIGKIEERK